jgi:Zinc-binding dehydrogenase
VLSAFAQRTVVPVPAAIKIPDDTPTDIAAVVGCAVQTGVGAVLNTAKVPPGASVVVGLGAVGLSVTHAARLSGARVIVAVDHSPSRREYALRWGATAALDPPASASTRPSSLCSKRPGPAARTDTFASPASDRRPANASMLPATVSAASRSTRARWPTGRRMRAVACRSRRPGCCPRWTQVAVRGLGAGSGGAAHGGRVSFGPDQAAVG